MLLGKMLVEELVEPTGVKFTPTGVKFTPTGVKTPTGVNGKVFEDRGVRKLRESLIALAMRVSAWDSGDATAGVREPPGVSRGVFSVAVVAATFVVASSAMPENSSLYSLLQRNP